MLHIHLVVLSIKKSQCSHNKVNRCEIHFSQMWRFGFQCMLISIYSSDIWNSFWIYNLTVEIALGLESCSDSLHVSAYRITLHRQSSGTPADSSKGPHCYVFANAQFLCKLWMAPRHLAKPWCCILLILTLLTFLSSLLGLNHMS